MLVRSLIGLLENGEAVLGGGTWKVKCAPATTARAAAASGTSAVCRTAETAVGGRPSAWNRLSWERQQGGLESVEVNDDRDERLDARGRLKSRSGTSAPFSKVRS